MLGQLPSVEFQASIDSSMGLPLRATVLALEHPAKGRRSSMVFSLAIACAKAFRSLDRDAALTASPVSDSRPDFTGALPQPLLLLAPRPLCSRRMEFRDIHGATGPTSKAARPA
jgi:hypothetical protein